VIEHAATQREALSSKPSTTKKEKKGNENKDKRKNIYHAFGIPTFGHRS
jgi:hypothetical protein